MNIIELLLCFYLVVVFIYKWITEVNINENLIELTPVSTDSLKHDIAAQSSRKEALGINNMRGDNSNTIQ